MAKEKQNTALTKAKDELARAQKAYEKLVHHDTGVLTDEERLKHKNACRDALDAKQAAAALVEALQTGRAEAVAK